MVLVAALESPPAPPLPNLEQRSATTAEDTPVPKEWPHTKIGVRSPANMGDDSLSELSRILLTRVEFLRQSGQASSRIKNLTQIADSFSK